MSEMNVEAERAADLAEFAKWKGYPLPALNGDGNFDKDWLHREWVAFRAGRRRAAQPADVGSRDLPELPEPRVRSMNPLDKPQAYAADQMRQYARAALAHQDAPAQPSAAPSALVQTLNKPSRIDAYVRQLAMSLWRTHYRETSPKFELLDDTHGVLTQIDNMITGLVLAAPTSDKQAGAVAQIAVSSDPVEPVWIVNSLGELGVQVNGRFFFCYKGDNIEYGTDGAAADGIALHDDRTPMLYRIVGKREFGETVMPAAWWKQGRSEPRYTTELVYTPGLSFGKPEDGAWRPLPAKKVRAAPAAIEQAGAQPVAQWGAVHTVGDFVRNLLTLNQAEPIYSAFHVDYEGERRCRTRPVSISRERVIDGKWVDVSRTDVPYANIVWAKPDERAAPTPATDQDALDAKRYRWLRAQPFDTWKRIGWNTWGDDPAVFPIRDEDIDSAMAATPVTDQPKQENQQ